MWWVHYHNTCNLNNPPLSGALQDIDQLSVFKSICKDRIRVTRVRHLQSSLARAIETACNGVPGPVLLELPVDVLYSHSVGEPGKLK